MRTTRTCPKCCCPKLFVIGKVHQPDCDNRTATHPMTVTSKEVLVDRQRFAGPDFERLVAGFFEAWVCSACGFTEWYARESNEVLARLAQHPDTGVVYLDGGAPTGPYR